MHGKKCNNSVEQKVLKYMSDWTNIAAFWLVGGLA